MNVEINLFIVGAVKCGTTSLYNYLNQHSDVFFSKVKEPNFYSSVESRIKQHYIKPKHNKFYQYKIIRSSDVYFSLYEDSENFKIVGESSTSYIWDKDAAQKIYNDFPDAKIIIMVRNPIKRAFSHYLMLRKSGQEKETDFYKALKIDKKREPKSWGKGAFLYEDLGLYHEQIERYYKVFKKENIKVIVFEYFAKNVREGLLDVFRFLEIDGSKVDEIDFNKKHNQFVTHKSNFTRTIVEIINKAGNIKNLVPLSLRNKLKEKYFYKSDSKPKMCHESQKYLNEVFKQDIIKLEGLLDINLKIWE